jgi:hypothetical protein
VGTVNLAIFKRGDNARKFEWVFRPPLGMGFQPHAARARRGEFRGRPGSIRSGNALFCGYNFSDERGNGSGRCDLHYQMMTIITRSPRVPVRPERPS